MRVAEPNQIFAESSVFPRYFVTGEILQYRYSLQLFSILLADRR